MAIRADQMLFVLRMSSRGQHGRTSRPERGEADVAAARLGGHGTISVVGRSLRAPRAFPKALIADHAEPSAAFHYAEVIGPVASPCALRPVRRVLTPSQNRPAVDRGVGAVLIARGAGGTENNDSDSEGGEGCHARNIPESDG